ncbi:MAG: cytochrome c family protein [Alphaproteobacteria bacterium]
MSRVGCVWILLAGLTASSWAWAETPQERGRYLMESIVACGNCHTPQGPTGPVAGMELAGGMVIEEAPFTAVASNITPDAETGIGRWTDEQIVRAIREGIRPDGSIIGPPMPIALYRGISDSDARALVAYLRQVKPVKNAVAKSAYRMPLPPSYGPPVGTVAAVPADGSAKYGAYMAGPLGHCIECHTPILADGQRDWTRTGAGGPPITTPFGPVVPPNITPHPQDGIGRWSDAQIVQAVAKGVSADGRKLNPPMGFGYYAHIKPGDMTALIAYLRALPPLPTAN